MPVTYILSRRRNRGEILAVTWKKIAYDADLTTHTGNTTTAHGAVSAATASKHVVRDASARAKFAAPGAAGDALVKGTRVTTAELPAMTDEKIWKGTGGNVEEVDMPTAGSLYASGSYTGNGGADRAIAHGLGAEPKLVIVCRDNHSQVGMVNGTYNLNLYDDTETNVTDWDATNFHVAPGMGFFNWNGIVYNWVAFK